MDREKNKKDICLAAAVLTAALVLGIVFWHDDDRDKVENADGLLEITIDGKLYGNFPLNKDMEMTIKNSFGSNTVVIEQGRAYVREADCPDKICVGMPEISREGEMICCLPHRLFLAVRDGEDDGVDAIVY